MPHTFLEMFCHSSEFCHSLLFFVALAFSFKYLDTKSSIGFKSGDIVSQVIVFAFFFFRNCFGSDFRTFIMLGYPPSAKLHLTKNVLIFMFLGKC